MQVSLIHEYTACLVARVERRLDVARQAFRRDQHDVEADVAVDVVRMARRARLRAAAMMRRCCRTITASAASSSRSRAFTSTKISVPRRRATMSISPTGLRQRRATMR